MSQKDTFSKKAFSQVCLQTFKHVLLAKSGQGGTTWQSLTNTKENQRKLCIIPMTCITPRI